MSESLQAYCQRNNRETLLIEWAENRNHPHTPSSIAFSSQKKIWWRCDKGHEWRAPVRSRTEEGRDCPTCSGKKLLCGYNDLATMYPNIAAEWAPENGSLTPADVLPGAKRRIWWECPRGHVWKASPAARVTESRACPYCTGRSLAKGHSDLKTLAPELAAQWHPTGNGALRPEDMKASSPKKVWWICEKGHIWQASVKSRMERSDAGCRICAEADREEPVKRGGIHNATDCQNPTDARKNQNGGHIE